VFLFYVTTLLAATVDLALIAALMAAAFFSKAIVFYDKCLTLLLVSLNLKTIPETILSSFFLSLVFNLPGLTLAF
jgi:hypothetical protein